MPLVVLIISSVLNIILDLFLVGVLFVLRHTLQGLGERILPLMSSVIELVLKTLIVIFLIPRLALAYRKNRYMGNA